MWCQRRRSRRRRPPGLERVPAMWWCRARHLASLRRPPLMKTRRRNKEALPLQRWERKRRRPPQQGRPRGRGKGRPLCRTAPPTPKRAERSGRTEPSVRRHRKYSHTRMTHSIFKCAAYPKVECYLRSPPRAALDDSSSGSLDSSDMNSVPPAVSPRGADDAEAASRRTGQEEVVLEEPQGNPQDPRSKGDETPQGSQSGFVPDTCRTQPSWLAVGELLPRGVSRLRRRPLSNQRRRIVCWRRLKAPPSTRSTVLLRVRWSKGFSPPRAD